MSELTFKIGLSSLVVLITIVILISFYKQAQAFRTGYLNEVSPVVIWLFTRVGKVKLEWLPNVLDSGDFNGFSKQNDKLAITEIHETDDTEVIESEK